MEGMEGEAKGGGGGRRRRRGSWGEGKLTYTQAAECDRRHTQASLFGMFACRQAYCIAGEKKERERARGRERERERERGGT